ncbi:MAG: hypothetical protein FJ161_02755 [Gammaproteobacteria bacterium]|nr:hypothetical protein [Gammaproteobacteria bacterium]
MNYFFLEYVQGKVRPEALPLLLDIDLVSFYLFLNHPSYGTQFLVKQYPKVLYEYMRWELDITIKWNRDKSTLIEEAQSPNFYERLQQYCQSTSEGVDFYQKNIEENPYYKQLSPDLQSLYGLDLFYKAAATWYLSNHFKALNYFLIKPFFPSIEEYSNPQQLLNLICFCLKKHNFILQPIQKIQPDRLMNVRPTDVVYSDLLEDLEDIVWYPSDDLSMQQIYIHPEDQDFVITHTTLYKKFIAVCSQELQLRPKYFELLVNYLLQLPRKQEDYFIAHYEYLSNLLREYQLNLGDRLQENIDRAYKNCLKVREKKEKIWNNPVPFLFELSRKTAMYPSRVLLTVEAIPGLREHINQLLTRQLSGDVILDYHHFIDSEKFFILGALVVVFKDHWMNLENADDQIKNNIEYLFKQGAYELLVDLVATLSRISSDNEALKGLRLAIYSINLWISWIQAQLARVKLESQQIVLNQIYNHLWDDDIGPLMLEWAKQIVGVHKDFNHFNAYNFLLLNHAHPTCSDSQLDLIESIYGVINNTEAKNTNAQKQYSDCINEIQTYYPFLGWSIPMPSSEINEYNQNTITNEKPLSFEFMTRP